MVNRAFLSLGSNIGNREEQLREAITRLAALGRVTALSSFYETEPVEVIEQDWFLNCALALETTETPQELMAKILRIEEQMGRRRAKKKGPRSIDIDLLLFNDEIIESKELTIPHSAMQERRFVLEPMAEIAADMVHPGLKKTMRELLDALPEGQVTRPMPQ